MAIDLPDIDFSIPQTDHVLVDHGTVPNCALFMQGTIEQSGVQVGEQLQDLIDMYIRTGVSMGGYHFISGNRQNIIIQEDTKIVMEAERARLYTGVALDIVGTHVLTHLTSALHMPDISGIMLPDEMREYGVVYGLLRRNYSVDELRSLSDHYRNLEYQLNFVDPSYEHPFPMVLETVLATREVLLN